MKDELLRGCILSPLVPFYPDGGLLIREGRIAACGDFHAIHEPGVPVNDLRGSYLLPGFIDTHLHFPQLRVIGGLGLELLDWLDRYALPEEARMADVAHASRVARAFTHALAAHGTTTAMVFGAHFAAATAELFTAAAETGLRLVSGMVLSDRRLRPELEQHPAEAYDACTELIERFHGRGRALYAVTPRFALSNSEAMLEVCQRLVTEHEGLRVQSHLNENPREIAAVAELFSGATDYFAVYERYGLCGPRAVMAHNVHPTEGELARLARTRTSVAHCPCSNAALGSGIFPLRRHLAAGVHVALGTDVGGGTGFGMPKEALQAYLLQRVAPSGMTLDPAQLLYLSTLAGAEALGLADVTGSLTVGKAADLVCLSPPAGSPLAASLELAETAESILAALFTQAGSESVREVRVEGDVIFARDAA
ncbi:MAG: guanine deaminase [Bryobacteraceae bacterium]|nr:guanine deaminase [Bryobacteraceae bacterium]